MGLTNILVRRSWRRLLIASVLSTLLIGSAAKADSFEGIEADPSLESLMFRSGVYSHGPVTLAHGEYRAPAAPGSASEIVIRLTDKKVFGVLNGRPAGAIVVVTSTGGTGTFYELALLSKTAQGWMNTDTVPLGDRVAVHSIAIDDPIIVVTMTTHGPRDPLCCPTQEVKQRFAVRDNHLVTIPY